MRVSQKAAALMDAMMDDSTEDEDDSAAAADGTSTAADDTSTAVAAEAPELESSEKTIGDAASKLGLRKSASGGGGGAAQQARMAMIVQVRRQSGLVLSCRVLSCLVLSCVVFLVLSCLVLSCASNLSVVFVYRVAFRCCCFCLHLTEFRGGRRRVGC